MIEMVVAPDCCGLLPARQMSACHEAGQARTYVRKGAKFPCNTANGSDHPNVWARSSLMIAAQNSFRGNFLLEKFVSQVVSDQRSCKYGT